MAPYTGIPLSPAELSYLHTSLSQHPPIRPDARSPTAFRPLIAETDILPAANGSARICFADGTEAIVGVKAEVEKTPSASSHSINSHSINGEVADEGVRGLGSGGVRDVEDDGMDVDGGEDGKQSSKGRDEWLEVAIDIPGMRDDDALPVFLSAMLTEALLADGALKDKLYINTRFHWRLYIDILLLSLPLSYPLPLLSLTTHLALLATRLPALVSEKDEDPLFNDDWEASTHLYPPTKDETARQKPPITLLVMSVGENILFDPSREELAVADAVVAISVTQSHTNTTGPDADADADADSPNPLHLIALRTIDPPSRLTAAGLPNSLNTSAGAGAGAASQSLSSVEVAVTREKDQGVSVWRPPRGGVKRAVLARMIKMVVQAGGVGEEVLGGLRGVEI
ncbi:Exosome complex component rrp42 [Recurvomyces mirabilis]|uniref:Ribosomal RNA-processing protein 42 n=1 Tax=Recurvomyces mirabilis TaxID=574656 RepID=A0AAE0TU98_9PEZI|nr:Exosome complex component rrp42 [Recurvomyces mirabilis]KAK5159892.1 Exosome complex component rrp42 [Recurvomyces mirabilis]